MCGLACFANVFMTGAPYHTLPMSLCTAYIHVPAYHGFRFWRTTLNDPRSNRLVENLAAQDSKVVARAVRVMSRGLRAMAVAQIFFVLVVCAAYALPSQPLHGVGAAAPRGDLETVRWHGRIMWAMVSVVLCSIVGQYALFILFSYLHLIEVALAGEHMIELMVDHFDAGADPIGADGDGDGDGLVRDSEATPKPRPVRDSDDSDDSRRLLRDSDAGRPKLPGYACDERFEGLLGAVAFACRDTQKNLTKSCEAWDKVHIHYFLFALAQILVVVHHVKLHTVGTLKDRPYAYYFFFQDAFFVGSATFIITATVICSASVTSKVHEIRHAVRTLAYARETTFRAAALSNVVNDHLLGMSCFGHPVDKQKVAMVMFAFIMLVLSNVIEILAARFNYVVIQN